MEQSLNNLLLAYNQKSQYQHQGLIIQKLKDNPFFKDLDSKYGTNVIIKYIPILEYYIIRDGMQLVHTHDLYIVYQGVIKLISQDSKYSKTFLPGLSIDQEQYQHGKLISKGDTNLIKITTTDQKHKKIKQSIQKLQKQQFLKFVSNKKLIQKNQQLLKIGQIISHIQLFQQIGQFDRYQLILNSKIQVLSKQSRTHYKGTYCRNIGYILTGKVKIVFYGENSEEDKIDKVIRKYMIRRGQINKDGLVSSQLKPGDWIGLQQHIWDCPFSSSGEISTPDSQILWISRPIFSQKINQTTLNSLFVKTKNLLQAKKQILQRSIISKEVKKYQMQQQALRKQNKNHLIQKLDQFKTQQRSKSIRVWKRQIYPQQCYLPAKIFHKNKIFQNKFETSLPKLDSRINLFPQQFQKALIPINLAQQIEIAQNRISGKKKGNNLSTINKNIILEQQKNNPQAIYQRILQGLNFRSQSQNSKQLKTLYPHSTIQTSTIKKQKQSVATLKKKKHFNFSIYNNFKIISRQKQANSSFSKTLEID